MEPWLGTLAPRQEINTNRFQKDEISSDQENSRFYPNYEEEVTCVLVRLMLGHSPGVVYKDGGFLVILEKNIGKTLDERPTYFKIAAF